MNILNQVFSKIYVISSYATQDRLNDLLPFLSKENIECELVISPKKKYFKDKNEDELWLGKGAFSLLSGNESIFLKEYYLKSKTFCILEDDIFFDVDYKNKLNEIVYDIPIDWQILNLGYHVNSSINYKFNSQEKFYKLKDNDFFVGTHIIGYNYNVVSFLLDKIENNKYPMDTFLNNNLKQINIYTYLNKIFYASSYREDECDKNESYKKYKTQIGT